MSTLMITGGAGFIGANYVLRRRRLHPHDRIVVVDSLTYAGDRARLLSCEGDSAHYRFVKAAIEDAEAMEKIFSEEAIDAVVHFAAESHVDRSILGPRVFAVTNFLGTQVLLDVARKAKLKRFLMVSTDEVYGSLGREGYFTETTPIQPSSPYSASKASADLITLAYHHTFGLDTVVTRCSNNYGPLQFPEKLIPLMITHALADKPLPVYGDGLNVRDWIHVDDHAAALDRVLESGRAGQVYNIGSNNERTNLEIVRIILAALKKPESLIKYVQDRPGHDRRYAIDSSKMKHELGWTPAIAWETGIQSTIQWYLENRDWWERIASGAYREYFERQYGDRLNA